MGPIQETIHAIMSGTSRPSPAMDFLLTTLSRIYGAGVVLRRNAFAAGLLKTRNLPCPVVSIGNLTAGGTGKTPMTLYLAGRMKAWGYHPAVISRGYHGAAEKSGGIVSDGSAIRMDAAAAGDEPFLMAASLAGIPVLVGHDRYRSGLEAVTRFQSDVLILDDAYQHLPLYRDTNLLLLDAASPFGNGRLLPRGTLREPASAVKYSDAVIFTRTEDPRCIPAEPWTRGRPVFAASHAPFISGLFSAGEKPGFPFRMDAGASDSFAGKRVYAFSGIARNSDFRDTLRKMGAHICGWMDFPDHYDYGRKDIDRILESALQAGADTLATTEKDLARLHGRFRLSMDCAVIGIRIAMADAMAFDRFIQNRISLHP